MFSRDRDNITVCRFRERIKTKRGEVGRRRKFTVAASAAPREFIRLDLISTNNADAIEAVE